MLTVYHGATCIVSQPLCLAGRLNLDFGQGFYTTDIRDQAITWAMRAANMDKPQWLNIYELDIQQVKVAYRYLQFLEYDKEWLDFIVNSRKGGTPWRDYDIVEGGVADDRVIDTVNLYMLDMIPAEIAVQRLAQHRPNNQICLLNQQLIDEHLKFIQAESLNEWAIKQEEVVR
ncbi:DUF3990 domain-containing protein [Phocaeicola sp.]